MDLYFWTTTKYLGSIEKKISPRGTYISTIMNKGRATQIEEEELKYWTYTYIYMSCCKRNATREV